MAYFNGVAVGGNDFLYHGSTTVVLMCRSDSRLHHLGLNKAAMLKPGGENKIMLYDVYRI